MAYVLIERKRGPVSGPNRTMDVEKCRQFLNNEDCRMAAKLLSDAFPIKVFEPQFVRIDQYIWFYTIWIDRNAWWAGGFEHSELSASILFRDANQIASAIALVPTQWRYRYMFHKYPRLQSHRAAD